MDTTPLQHNKSGWVNGLDSLRFILALCVALSHLHNPYHEILKSAHVPGAGLLVAVIDHLFPGVVAVSAFFIISGFVIHHSVGHVKKLDVPSFLVRRWIRVGLPLLIVLLLAQRFGPYILAMVWSLYCELFFYTIYPVLFRIRSSWQSKTAMAWVVSVIVTCFLVAIDTRVLPSRMLGYRNVNWQVCICLINLPVWMTGVLLAEQFKNAVQRTVTIYKLNSLRIVVYLISITIIVVRMRYRVSTIYTCLLMTPLLYLWLRAEIMYFSTHRPARLIEAAGRFSYSLYLWHLFIFLCIGMVIKPGPMLYFADVVGCIIFSYIAYLLVERPAHMLARKLAMAISRNN